MAKIVVISGPAQGLQYEVSEEAIVGRQSENAIPLPDSKASRQHSRIYYHRDQGYYYIEDMESCNGTTVNGNLIACQRLCSGDLITIGQTQLRFDEEMIKQTAVNRQHAQIRRPEHEPKIVTSKRQIKRPIGTQKRVYQKSSSSAVAAHRSPANRSGEDLRSPRNASEYSPKQLTTTPITSFWLWVRKFWVLLWLVLFAGVFIFCSRWLTLWMLE